MVVLSIVIWATAYPQDPQHRVDTGAMPRVVCEALADKLNMPMFFQRRVEQHATCIETTRWVLEIASTRGYTPGQTYTSKAECDKAAEVTAHGGSYCAIVAPK